MRRDAMTADRRNTWFGYPVALIDFLRWRLPSTRSTLTDLTFLILLAYYGIFNRPLAFSVSVPALPTRRVMTTRIIPTDVTFTLLYFRDMINEMPEANGRRSLVCCRGPSAVVHLYFDLDWRRHYRLRMLFTARIAPNCDVLTLWHFCCV